MASRRMERVSRTLQAVLSQVIQNHLSDPRVRGLISVTRVSLACDLRSARVYLSVLGVDEKQQQLSLRGIRHARGHIQHLLGRQVSLKTCPQLHFYLDDSLKKGFEMVQLIDRVAAEFSDPEVDKRAGEAAAPMEHEDERQQ